MDVEVKLSRSDKQPWGVRLSGGVDFAFPLTAVRVTMGGLADQAGLRAGDVIVKINGETISHLRHSEVLERIVKLGNEFGLTVLRDLKFRRKPKKEETTESEYETTDYETTDYED